MGLWSISGLTVVLDGFAGWVGPAYERRKENARHTRRMDLICRLESIISYLLDKPALNRWWQLSAKRMVLINVTSLYGKTFAIDTVDGSRHRHHDVPDCGVL